ncbi:T9SS type A sorting domain-containing protein [bacterium]|nr:T9SS type A sorting domain-containing protein [bacterium]
MGGFEDPLDSSNIYYYGFYGDYTAPVPYEWGGLVCSNDGGQTWNNANPVIRFNRDFGSSDGIVEAALRMSNGNFLASYRNLDSAVRDDWIQQTLVLVDSDGVALGRFGEEFPDNYLMRNLVEVAGHPGRILAATPDNPVGLYRSDDYGLTWTLITGNGLPDQRIMIYSISQMGESGNIYLGTYDWGSFVSADGGDSWETVSLPVSAQIYQMSFESTGSVAIVNGNGRLWVDRDGDAVYSELSYPQHPDSVALHWRAFLVGDTLFSYVNRWSLYSGEQYPPYSPRIYQNNAGSEDWMIVTSLSDIQAFYFHELPGGVRLARFSTPDSQPASIAYSEDAGRTWETAPGTLQLNENCAIEQTDTSAIVVGNSTLYAYTFATGTWEDLSLPHGGPIQQGTVVADSDLVFFLSYNPHRLFVYENEMWQIRSTPDFSGFANLSHYHRDEEMMLFVSNDHDYTVSVSFDTARTWQPVSLELPLEEQGVAVRHVYVDQFQDRLWIDTGMGVYWTDLTQFTSVDDPLPLQPIELSFMRAYPNPANAAVKLSVHLKESGRTGFNIYNVLGQKVYAHEAEYLAAGDHTFVWDTSNVPSGTYVARMNIPGGEPSISKRITVLK